MGCPLDEPIYHLLSNGQVRCKLCDRAFLASNRKKHESRNEHRAYVFMREMSRLEYRPLNLDRFNEARDEMRAAGVDLRSGLWWIYGKHPRRSSWHAEVRWCAPRWAHLVLAVRPQALRRVVATPEIQRAIRTAIALHAPNVPGSLIETVRDIVPFDVADLAEVANLAGVES